jgi:hypothetical protein
MAYMIQRDWSLQHSPQFNFEPHWHPGGDNLVDETWYMMGKGLRIPIAHVPKRGILIGSQKSLKDVVALDIDAWCVSERFKMIVEKVAPGQIEYVPISLVRKNKEPLSDLQYYFINVLPRLDTINWHETTGIVAGPDKMPSGHLDVELTEDAVPNFVLSRTRLSGIHIWHEILHWSSFCGLIFISDELAKALMGSVTGLIFNRMNES